MEALCCSDKGLRLCTLHKVGYYRRKKYRSVLYVCAEQSRVSLILIIYLCLPLASDRHCVQQSNNYKEMWFGFVWIVWRWGFLLHTNEIWYVLQTDVITENDNY